jgi:UDP-N-acetyl-D-mannosaminuronic acid transferase (WecB/TagA/CpsF family)
MAYKDKEFKNIIQRSDIALCDGVGLLCAYEFLQNYNASGSLLMKYIKFVKSYLYILKNGSSSDGTKVIKGRDFILDLLNIAEKNRYRVFLLGSTGVVMKKALRNL